MKIALLIGAAVVSFTLVFYLTPPKEVVGSRLDDFDQPYRRRRMIELEEQQYRDMGFV